MKRLRAIIMAAAALALAAPAAAQPGWRLLGAHEVGDGAGSGTIQVAGGRRFGEVRICVRHHNVRFRDVDIRFVNGGNQSVRLRSIIVRDSCTGALVLRGGRREIASIAFTYEAAARAQMGVYAR